ncbi:hypothetical protein IV203_036553 [Nitzschia inconspicua]|uniref:RED-like N-terminal domain-containing protein n=1 Tax=Nitzschia inconspicua TaxID=303405 RepID=A0A9K3PVR2_9STRA|nr:hypothetical protein IV203_036553 [Nitzschia inconspicua]
MDNDAFQDLVRKQVGSSSKEIARKAVEDEFRKKKKRKRGGGYASSSDEEEDKDDVNHDNNKNRKSKKGKQEEEDMEAEKERAKAVEEDLAKRYRDRAKERREGDAAAAAAGGGGTINAIDVGDNNKVSQMEFLIVPHNKKGLDLSLIRKERQGLKKKHQPSNSTTASSLDSKAHADIVQVVRKELPSREDAMEILQDFVNDNNKYYYHCHSSSVSSSSVSLNKGLAEYLREFVKWTNEPIHGKHDTVSCSATGRTLQNTKFAFAIDGHPSDTARAWQSPRQFTISSTSTTSSSSASSMLTRDVLDQIERVFERRKRVLEDMKQQQPNALSSSKSTSKENNESSGKQDTTKEDSIVKVEEFDEDDDIFGGLDDYVPPVPKGKD